VGSRMSCFVTKKVSPLARPTKAVRREERAASARGVTKDQPEVDVEMFSEAEV